MPAPKTPKKIVYLFGAGSTHAELINFESKDSGDAVFLKEQGLLMRQVSERVIAKARRNSNYLKDIEMVSAAKGSLNIELLISLIENSKIPDSTRKTSILKDLVTKDITGILTRSRLRSFYLHKALLELHNKTTDREKLLGLISLNYDGVLDAACKTIYRTRPHYYFSSNENSEIPLLKLHGSFNWKNVRIRGRVRNIEIIPLGVNKNYVHLPYNLIWSRALEVLIECDILRVIGCSLSPNDIHLIDLLFKAHLERGNAFEIQIIGPEKTGQEIKEHYGFFPEIKTLTNIEPPLIPDQSSNDVGNAFKLWLKYKSLKMLNRNELKATKYLKRTSA
jgi:hypothetical protein